MKGSGTRKTMPSQPKNVEIRPEEAEKTDLPIEPVDVDYFRILADCILTAFLRYTGMDVALPTADPRLHYVINLYVVTPERIAEINAIHRQVNAITDVITFPAFQWEEGRLCEDITPWLPSAKSEISRITLGEIFICPEQAKIQAVEYGHSLTRELGFLLIHSLLHTFGYDHISLHDTEMMERLQAEIINDLGLGRELSEEEARRFCLTAPLKAHRIAWEVSFIEQDQNETEKKIKSGSVCLIGRPNAGKSTILNALAGQVLAITSYKAQTTRRTIRYVHNTPTAQIIFLDTPGIHRPENMLGELMQTQLNEAIVRSDCVLLVTDCRQKSVPPAERIVIKLAKEEGKPLILALNKVDLVEKTVVLPLIAAYNELADWAGIVPISALHSDGLDILLEEIIRVLPEGRRLLPDDYFTDQTERELVRELVREVLLTELDQEVPHSLDVMVSAFTERFDSADKRIGAKISCDIICDRESHRPIILGRKGKRIRKIGSLARQRCEDMLECPIYLDLQVKVQPGWRNKRGDLQELGYV
ncbi:MAG: GTPase Era [Clostridiaceae bacterium]|nr:GTPase Era [Clostridiaceae bacterium]